MKKASLVVVIVLWQALSALAAPNQTFLPLVMSNDTPTPTPTGTPTPTVTPTNTPTNTPIPMCDAAYPTVCIAPPPPDLNCSDIPYRNFTVLQPDPHGFDNNHDGVGCETP